jgi:hypothetical protein
MNILIELATRAHQLVQLLAPDDIRNVQIGHLLVWSPGWFGVPFMIIRKLRRHVRGLKRAIRGR